MAHDSQLIKSVIDTIRSELKPEISRFVAAMEIFADQKLDLQTLNDKISELQATVKSLHEKIETHESRITSVLEYASFFKESANTVGKLPEKKIAETESIKNSDGYKTVIRLSIVELRDINNLTFQEIADKLNAQGIQTFRKSGKKWYPQTVQKIYKQMKQEISG